MAIFGGEKKRQGEDIESRITELERKIEQLEEDVKSRDLVLRATNNELTELTRRIKTYEEIIFETKARLDIIQTYESYRRMDEYLRRINPLFKLTALLEQVTQKSDIAPLVEQMNAPSLSHVMELEENPSALRTPAEIQKRRDDLEKLWSLKSEEIQRHAAMQFDEMFNDSTLENYFQFTWVTGGYCVENYIGFDDEILFIPKTFKREPIVELKEGLFLNCRTLKTLVIDAPVKIIPKSFAEGCKVEQVILNEGVNRIEVSAFQGSELCAIDLGGNVQRIAENAFRSTPLVRIELPESLSMIGKHAFADTSVESITIPPRLNVIPPELFEDCPHLQEVVLEEGLVRIESCAFRKKFLDHNKPMPPEITIPRSVEYIEGEENTHTYRPFHKSTIIHCYQGSYGQQWAREHGYTVKNAEDASDTAM